MPVARAQQVDARCTLARRCSSAQQVCALTEHGVLHRPAARRAGALRQEQRPGDNENAVAAVAQVVHKPLKARPIVTIKPLPHLWADICEVERVVHALLGLRTSGGGGGTTRAARARSICQARAHARAPPPCLLVVGGGRHMPAVVRRPLHARVCDEVVFF